MNCLSEKFDVCILGRTVSALFEPQIVYSLSGLLKMHKGDRESVANLMKQAFEDYGAAAPIFVDDEANEGGQTVDCPDPKPAPQPTQEIIEPPFTRVPMVLN